MHFIGQLKRIYDNILFVISNLNKESNVPKPTVLSDTNNYSNTRYCKPYPEIINNDHQDIRILVYYLEKLRYRTPSNLPFYTKDETGYSIVKLVQKLEELKLIHPYSTKDYLSSKYIIDELKPLLKNAGLPTGGKKNELIDRIVEHDLVKVTQKECLTVKATFTEKGISILQEREDDRLAAFWQSVDAMKLGLSRTALEPLYQFDAKWGFTRKDKNKLYSIFANYYIPGARFEYLSKYKFSELNNSDEFKQLLCCYMLVGLSCGMSKGDSLIKFAPFISNELLNCPTLLQIYAQSDLQNDRGVSDRNRWLEGLKESISNDPLKALEYYISRVFYESREATREFLMQHYKG